MTVMSSSVRAPNSARNAIPLMGSKETVNRLGRVTTTPLWICWLQLAPPMRLKCCVAV